MGRLPLSLSFAIAIAAIFNGVSLAQQQTAYDLLPDTVQGIVWIADGNDMVDRWHQTAIHQLSLDPAIRPFFEEQQELIERRLTEAGWRLGVKPQELTQYFQGQVAVAWLTKDDERKPYALSMVADIADDEKENEQLVIDIERALAHREATKKQHTHLGESITQFILPRRPDQLLEESTFVATIGGKLLVSDEMTLVQELVAKLKGEEVSSKPLSENADFVANREHLKISGKAQIEYFVRPIGIAKIIRALGGSPSKSKADILEVLKNQGFTSIKSIAGEVWLAEGDTDLAHRGFVLADFPLPRSAGVLDFPNESMKEVPSFVTSNAASFFTISWNVQTAFWKVRELVDELVGNEGVFDEIINGIRTDINGPQVDIRTELLPLLTNDIVSVTDNQPGEITVGSHRNLIGIKVNDAAKAAKILDRVMKAEANAEATEFEGIQIWKVSNEADEFESEEFADFGDFGDEEEEKETEKPWLDHWAITVLPTGDKDGYFLFTSHTEMLQEAITQAKSGMPGLAGEQDYQRIHAAIMQLMDSETPCAWNITRNKMSLRSQYELFRQGKLSDSESMLSKILQRLRENAVEENGELTEKKVISGDSLPPFEKIAEFFQPSGFKMLATPNGWEFGGLLLSDNRAPESDLSNANEGTTARIVDTTSDAKR